MSALGRTDSVHAFNGVWTRRFCDGLSHSFIEAVNNMVNEGENEIFSAYRTFESGGEGRPLAANSGANERMIRSVSNVQPPVTTDSLPFFFFRIQT